MYKAADSEIETSLRLGGPDGLATSEKDDLPLADFAGCMTKLPKAEQLSVLKNICKIMLLGRPHLDWPRLAATPAPAILTASNHRQQEQPHHFDFTS